MSVERHFRLSRPAFDIALEPDLFYPSSDHEEALSRMEFLAREGGTKLGLVTGEIGCGKSLTRAVFAKNCAGRRLVAQITSSHFPFSALMRSAVTQFGGADPGPEVLEYDIFRRFQEVLVARRWPAVILFDEAQEMSRDSLVSLRALSNLADGRFDVTLILVGQPELRDLIRSLPQLDQRAGLRYHIEPLPEMEVGAYLEFRLKAAGHPDGKLFCDVAAEEMTRVSRGVPREINRIARLAMALAERDGEAVVDRRHVLAVVRDLERQRGLRVA